VRDSVTHGISLDRATQLHACRIQYFTRILASELLPQESLQTSKGTVRLSKFGAPRPVPLLHRRPTKGKTSTDSTHECR